MIVGVDARPLSYPLTGIGVYLKHVLDMFQKIDRKNKYVLISNSPIAFQLKSDRWNIVHGNCGKRLLSTPWMQTYAPTIAIQKKIDLFWGPRHHLPLFLNSRVKTVLTVHDIVNQRYPETMALPNLIAERLLMRRSIRKANAIITDAVITVADIKSCFKVGSKQIAAIYPGVPNFESTEASMQTLPERFFLFVGTLDPRKNFNRILEAFEKSDPHRTGAHLVITGGKGWKNKNFLQKLEKHPLKSRVHLTGYVKRSELSAYYMSATCLLFPSIYEGFGFPILEAMSMRCPVITSNLSSMPEVAGDAALKVNPFDSEAIAKAMKEMMLSDSLRNRLREKGTVRAGQFSWKTCAEKTLQIFERVCNS